MNLANYVGQIVYVKTTDDNVVMGKIITKHNIQNTEYKLKVLEENVGNIDLDMLVSAD